MFSCKSEIPVLSGFLTKQVVQIPEKENCIDLCLFKNGLISPGSKLQLKVQKISTTTRACLFPNTLYSLIPHNESQLERLFYFASVFHIHWLSASLTAAGVSVQICPPTIYSTLKAPKSALKQRKRNGPANA